MAQNVIPYKLTTHRHVPEIKQELGRLSPGIKVNFTPHVVPSVRGILTTAHVFAREDAVDTLQDRAKVAEIYREFYRDAHFVRMADSVPKLASVRGSNFCDISFEPEKGSDRLVVISAIDNLVKGASGQAIQNMNLMAGFDERTGLWFPGMSP
jgi:N-acetyl-gamma-glutamyl-phosphate reductase